MKNQMRHLAVCAVFLVLLVGVLYYLNWVFHLKSTDGTYPAQMLYRQEKNTIDVLCLGSSHVYSNINPAILWDEYGMAAYDYAGSNQPLWNTYYYLKEALKYQTPELVIVDVYRMLETEDYQEDARVAMNTFGLRYSLDLAECLRVSLAKPEQYMSYLLRYPVYHSKYTELKQSDFLLYNGDVNGKDYKGFNLNCKSTMPFESLPDVSGVTEIGTVSEKSSTYLEKTVELAKEREIPVFLVCAPYAGVTAEEKACYNRVEQLADEWGVPFLDFNECFEEIGFDPANDFAEQSHLNYYGSEKYTSYLGACIREMFEVSDRRGDARYASWDANSAFYHRQAANVDLKKTEDIDAYFEKLFANSQYYTISVDLRGDYRQEAEDGGIDVAALLGAYGMDVNESCSWLFQNGEVVDTLAADPGAGHFYYLDMGRSSITSLTELRHDYDADEDIVYREISMEGIGCTKVSDGINVLVYDNDLQTVVDSMGLDAADSYAFVR